MIVHASFQLFDSKYQGKTTPHQLFRDLQWWRVKVKNKRMKDRLRAMHQGTILFFFNNFFLTSSICLLIVYLVKHGWSSVTFLRSLSRSLPVSWMTLLLFNSHTPIFLSFLTVDAEVFRPMLRYPCPPKHACVWSTGPLICCVMLQIISRKCKIPCRYNIIWPCLKMGLHCTIFINVVRIPLIS